MSTSSARSILRLCSSSSAPLILVPLWVIGTPHLRDLGRLGVGGDLADVVLPRAGDGLVAQAFTADGPVIVPVVVLLLRLQRPAVGAVEQFGVVGLLHDAEARAPQAFGEEAVADVRAEPLDDRGRHHRVAAVDEEARPPIPPALTLLPHEKLLEDAARRVAVAHVLRPPPLREDALEQSPAAALYLPSRVPNVLRHLSCS